MVMPTCRFAVSPFRTYSVFNIVSPNFHTLFGNNGEVMKLTKRMIWLSMLLLCTTPCGADDKEIAVQLTVPDAAWTIAIDEVHQVGNELWVIATVSRDPDMMGAQVISIAQASLRLAAPDLPAKYFIIGKTWDWKNAEPYTFIQDVKQIETELNAGELLYTASKPRDGS